MLSSSSATNPLHHQKTTAEAAAAGVPADHTHHGTSLHKGAGAAGGLKADAAAAAPSVSVAVAEARASYRDTTLDEDAPAAQPAAANPASAFASRGTDEAGDYVITHSGVRLNLDGAGGRALAPGWTRYTDASDVWYSDAAGETHWTAEYATADKLR